MTQDMKTKIITYSRIVDDAATETSTITVVLPEPTLQVRGVVRTVVQEWTRKGAELDTRYNERKQQLPSDGTEIERAKASQDLEIERLHTVSDYVHEMNVAMLRSVVVRSAMTADDVAFFDDEGNDQWMSIKDVADAVNSFRQLLGT